MLYLFGLMGDVVFVYIVWLMWCENFLLMDDLLFVNEWFVL